jgi:hypothetical protein
VGRHAARDAQFFDRSISAVMTYFAFSEAPRGFLRSCSFVSQLLHCPADVLGVVTSASSAYRCSRTLLTLITLVKYYSKLNSCSLIGPTLVAPPFRCPLRRPFRLRDSHRTHHPLERPFHKHFPGPARQSQIRRPPRVSTLKFHLEITLIR